MTRAWFALAVFGVLGLFYVGYGLQSGSAAFAQEEARPPRIAFAESTWGRFQMKVMDGAANGTSPHMFVCDTATGECWATPFGPGVRQRWIALSNPRAVKPDAEAADKPAGKAADTAPRLPPAK